MGLNNILFNKIKSMIERKRAFDWLIGLPTPPSPQMKWNTRKKAPKKRKENLKNNNKKGLKTSKAQYKVFRIHFDMDTYEIHIPYARKIFT